MQSQIIQSNPSIPQEIQIGLYSYFPKLQIGKGLCSRVYKGYSHKTGKPVAVKVVDTKKYTYEFQKHLHDNQLKILKQISNCKNLLNAYEIYNVNHQTFIITSLAQGDLKKFITSKIKFNEELAIQYIRCIINGFRNLQNYQIVHRDLKPENILIINNIPTISDFGFSQYLSQLNSKKYQGFKVGSLCYMPPQTLQSNVYSSQNDVWSIGVIFYEMIMGCVPWTANTQKGLLTVMKSKPISKILPQNISQNSKQFLMKTLTLNVNMRMTAKQLINYNLSKHIKINPRINKAPSININKHDLVQVQTKSLAKYENRPKRAMSLRENNPQIQILKNSLYQKQKYTKTPILSKQYEAKISDFLLSRANFSRLVGKVIDKIKQNQGLKLEALQQNRQLLKQLYGLLFYNLKWISSLQFLDKDIRQEYKQSHIWKEIVQSLHLYKNDYLQKYQYESKGWNSYTSIKQLIKQKILKLLAFIKDNCLLRTIYEDIVILDMLITIYSLIQIIEIQDPQVFPNNTNMQIIVDRNFGEFQGDNDIINILESKIQKVVL